MSSMQFEGPAGLASAGVIQTGAYVLPRRGYALYALTSNFTLF